MTAQSIKTWFESHPTLSKLREGITQTTALERDLATLVPAYLMPYMAVGLLRQAKLTIFVAQSAYAAKLRPLAPSLLETLHRRGWAVDSLRIRVRIPTAQELSGAGGLFSEVGAPYPVRQKEACLSECAWKHLQQLNAKLDPSPLKHAVFSMIEHHRKF